MNESKTLLEAIEKQKNNSNQGITYILGSDEEKFISYADFYKESLKYLYALQKIGLSQGDEVIFQIQDHEKYLLFFWGCILGRIIPVPLTAGGTDENKIKLFKTWKVLNNPYLLIDTFNFVDLSQFAEKTEYKTLFSDIESRKTIIEEIPVTDDHGTTHPPSPEDIAFIQFSSGSTGDPKGVILTHKNLSVNINGMIAHFDSIIHPDDNYASLSWMPLTHDMGMIGTHLTPLFSGTDQYTMHPIIFIMDPILWILKLHEHKISHTASPNFGFRYVLSKMDKKRLNGCDLSAVTTIFNGAEPISAEICDLFLNAMAEYGLKRSSMFTVYGLAEACLAVAFPKAGKEFDVVYVDRHHLSTGETVKYVNKNDGNAVSFVVEGAPIQGTQLNICGKEGRHLDENKIGYIWVKGENVTSGYYNNKKATRNLINQDGWLNTEDLGFISDGNLVVTGRAKDIIFSNGRNYYSHDLERIAENIEGFGIGKIAVVDAYNHETGQNELNAFIKYRDKGIDSFIPLAKKLRDHIYFHTGLVIHNFIPIEKLPRTTSGKLQRYKLQDEINKGTFLQIIKNIHALLDGKQKTSNEANEKENEAIQHYTEVERILVKIWQDVFNNSGIGAKSNFFELGGSSLSAIHIASRIKQELQVEFPIRLLFEPVSIRELAVSIGAMLPLNNNTVVASIHAIGPGEYYEVSRAQQRLWFQDKIINNKTAFNIPAAILLEDISINIALFEQTLRSLMKRHESLRTTFFSIDGKPFQKISDDDQCTLKFSDMTQIKDKEEYLHQTLLKEKNTPFNLEKGPLFRVHVLQFSNRKYAIAITMHHIISDGWSIRILLKELMESYAALCENKTPLFPKLTVQYKDFAHWHNIHLENKTILQQGAYWQKALGGDLPVLELPTDYSRPAEKTHNGRFYKINIGCESAIKIRKRAQENRVTEMMLTLAVFNVFLHKITGQNDIIIGIPSANRNMSEIEPLIGFFVNMLPIRLSITNNPKFTEFLETVKQRSIEAYANQDFPFDKIVERLNPVRDLSRSLIFDVVFEFREAFTNLLQSHDERTYHITDIIYNNPLDEYDLSLTFSKDRDDIILKFDYNADLFEHLTIARMADCLLTLTQEILDNPEKRMSELHLLNKAEHQRIVTEFSGGKRKFPAKLCIHTLFEQHAKSNSDSIALIFNDKTLSYAELNTRANKLAHYLKHHGVIQETLVGIYLERSFDMVIALLAILKAGGAYVPLDPAYPSVRIGAILEDAQVSILITQSSLKDQLPTTIALSICIDDDKKKIALYPDSDLDSVANSDNLAYVIYTSGSTGKPNGVLISHSNVVRLFESTKHWFNFNNHDTWTFFHSVAFDFSVWEIWGPLLSGGALVIVSYLTSRSPEDFYQLLAENHVTVLNQTPSSFRQIIQAEERLGVNSDLKLRYIIFGGEALEFQSLKPWFDRHGDKSPQLVNMYGITETTVHTTYYPLTTEDAKCCKSIIGVPIPDLRVYILDQYKQPTPIGTAGELYIGGPGVARGYLNREGLTHKRFLLDHMMGHGERLYKSGDLARFLPDGRIEYLGRIDQQVKIRGFRIELGEVESSLKEHAAVKACCVMSHNASLIAYIAFKEGSLIDNTEIRAFLRERLPEYMVPSKFIKLQFMPLTANFKIDKKALVALADKEIESSDNKYVVPVTRDEKLLAGIWAEILKRDRIGINDNFFDLGGHSLLVTQAVYKIKNTFSVALPVNRFFQNPTIKGMIQELNYLRHNASDQIAHFDYSIDFDSESLLDHSIRPTEAFTDSPITLRAVFLTGAAGFLGIYLLHELLNQSEADIYCLIRATSVEAAWEKLTAKLNFYSLKVEDFRHRIKPVIGDLSLPNLGLSESQYLKLAATTEVIYHNGAMVNHIYPYAMVKAANVSGTKEILKFAVHTKTKPVHFISSVSVLTAPMGGNTDIYFESEHLNGVPSDHGYAQSKWVAEKLLREAGNRGLPVCIYRPSRIIGHSKTGIMNPNDLLTLSIKSFIQNGKAPLMGDIKENVVPVDYVASAIFYLSMQSESFGKTFHLTNPSFIDWRNLYQWMNHSGYPIQEVSFDEWLDEVENQNDNAIQPLVPLFQKINTNDIIENNGLFSVQYDNSNTIRGLSNTAIHIPPIDIELFRKYLKHI